MYRGKPNADYVEMIRLKWPNGKRPNRSILATDELALSLLDDSPTSLVEPD
jgi:hypothetical protein